MVAMLPLLCAVWLFAAFSGITAHAVGDIPIDEEHFPDANFRTCFSGNWADKDENGILSESELVYIKSLRLENKGITDLSGIEYFTNLQELYCNDNDLTFLDVSKNTALRSLYCYNNQLASLDTSQNISLENLDCSSNELSELDISKNAALKSLRCYNCGLDNLDTYENTVLTSVYCLNNRITSLDMSNNAELLSLRCDNNEISFIDISNCPKLFRLDCNNNYLAYVNVTSTSDNFSFQCSDNVYVISEDFKSSNIDTSKIPGFDKSKVSDVNYADYNSETGIFSNVNGIVEYNYEYKNGKKKTFIISSNPINISIDEKHFPDSNFRKYLINEFSKDTDITSFNIKHRMKVRDLNIFDLKIKDLTGIEYFPNLHSLMCDNNELTSLDTSKNGALTTLYCTNNKLASINVSGNSALVRLECQNNNLSSLDISNNKKLEDLSCENNNLSSLNLINNTSLRYLDCHCNYIKRKSDIIGLNESMLNWCQYQSQYYKGYVSYFYDVELNISKILTNTEQYLNTRRSVKEVGKPSEDVINNSGGIWFVGKSSEPIYSCSDSNVTIDKYDKITIKKAGKYTITMTIENGTAEGVDLVQNFTITAIDLKDHTEHEYTVWSSAYDENGKETGHYQECFCGERSKIEPHTFEIINVKTLNGDVIAIKRCSICSYNYQVEETTVITNKETNIKLTALDDTVLDSSLTLNVNEVENVTMPNGKTALAYDITLTDTNGTEVQPNGSIRVTIPVPAGVDGQKTTVYRKESNGTYTNMNAMYNSTDNTLSFVTDHLSIYAIVENSGITGDVNGDGYLDNFDLLELRKYISDITNEYDPKFDVNSDGYIDNFDLLELRKVLSSLTA